MLYSCVRTSVEKFICAADFCGERLAAYRIRACVSRSRVALVTHYRRPADNQKDTSIVSGVCSSTVLAVDSQVQGAGIKWAKLERFRQGEKFASIWRA